MPRFQIEEKHTYFNIENNPIYGNNDLFNVLQPLGNIRTYSPSWPVEGTGEQDRIGRKITTQRIIEEGYLSLDNSGDDNTLLDYWNGYVQQMMSWLDPSSYEFPVDQLSTAIPIRHMYVEFDEHFRDLDPQERAIYVSNWFNATFIPAIHLPYLTSVQQKMLRESTDYTGNFTILKDDIYWLDLKDKKQIHFQIDLPYKKTVNFDAQGGQPTNSFIYSIWIGPIQPYIDYRNRQFGEWVLHTNNSTTPFKVAYLNSTMKLKYVDL